MILAVFVLDALSRNQSMASEYRILRNGLAGFEKFGFNL
jgi:hypothetical protein